MSTIQIHYFFQLGSPPVEDFSIRRFLNGKLIVNKYAKRLIKLPNSGINIVEKPIEISSIPKLQYLFTHNGNCPDRYLRVSINRDSIYPVFTCALAVKMR